MSDAWLDEIELEKYTGFTWKSKQQLALADMEIPFKVNPRGRILVLRDIVFGKPPRKRQKEPDWSAMNHGT